MTFTHAHGPPLGSTHPRSVSVIKGVLYQQVLEHADGNYADLPELLEGSAHLPEQQSHQEVISAEFIR